MTNAFQTNQETVDMRLTGDRTKTMHHFSKKLTTALLGTAFLGPWSMQALAQNLVPLELYWSEQRQDNFVTATPEGGNSAIGAGYSYARVEGCVFDTRQLGTVPLNLYWSPQREDNFTTATSVGAQSARQAGYTFARTEGYVYPNQREGTVPLNLYWSPQREDNFTTATKVGAQSALQAGYSFARVEGYVFPADSCQ